MSGRAEYRDDNLGFLQNLLEAAGRDDTPLAVYVSLLFEEADVEAILPRTNPFRHDLSRRRDEKIRFLLHRLVGDVTDPDGVASLAKEYTDVLEVGAFKPVPEVVAREGVKTASGAAACALASSNTWVSSGFDTVLVEPQ
jgi:hypothetical protein